MNFTPVRNQQEFAERQAIWKSLPKIKKLDVVISRACNLSCEGCVTFSQFKDIKGVYRWADQKDNILAWLDRVQVEDTVCLFGGEPFLNPDLHLYIEGICEYLANQYRQSMLFIQTNGLRLLDRPEILELYQHPEIARRLHIDVSYHTSNTQARAKMDQGIEYFQQGIADNIKNTWDGWNHSGFTVTDYVGNKWVKHYEIENNQIVPNNSFDGDEYIKSHEWCHIKDFINLFEGRLYKCPPMAVLNDYLQSRDSYNPVWNDWLEYNSCGLDDDLESWLSTQSGPERVCNMCFARKDDYYIEHDGELKYPIK